MVDRLAKIVSVEEQNAAIRKTGTTNQYRDFYSSSFPFDSNRGYPFRFEKYAGVPLTELTPQFVNLVTLISVLGAQFGYHALYGQFQRHEDHHWRRSPFDPRHQLALACYIAQNNEQSFLLKQTMLDLSEESGLEPGIWGIWYPEMHNKFDHDQITQMAERRVGRLKDVAQERLRRRQPIYLPNFDLNKKLASLKFIGDQADGISHSAFTRKVYPKAAQILEEYIDPLPAFQGHRKFALPWA